MKTLTLTSLAVSLAGIASAQSVVLMPDSASANNRIVTFSPVDGSLINSNLFGLASATNATPVSAIAVGSEIWVSEQVGDKISRYDSTGTFLGAVGVGVLDNCRGITLINGVVYAANDGNTFGAGDTLARFDTNGNHLGNYSTAGLNTSPFYVLEHNGTLLTSSASPNDDVHRFNTDGTSAGTFYNGANSFAEQMAIAPNGNVMIGWFTTGKVAYHDPSTGAELSSFPASGCRGVYQLSNGNVLWSNSSGAHVYDVNSATSTTVYPTTGGRFFSLMGSAATQNLSGNIILNDTVATFAATRSISYEVKQGATTVASGTISANSPLTAFNISLSPSLTGDAEVILEGSSFLVRKVLLTLTGSNQTLGNTTMVNGDPDDSGEVDAADIDLVIADFGSFAVGATDADVSGEVDAADIDIVIANFGAVDN
ncbi:MAG: hypothetical protein IT206_03240 [Fimbriimonadaceae bacterium]|nr:hypothetical protein [Fimbriimonadaceae bacterium]